ncbi:putative aspartate aminotransferase, cytoplasmic 2 isoform X1 [Lontra canadensis]|uniref:putative aspartate aminotransferase, cytoplasmic 2 isoform X1 n=2 Tax=Lontra canadensis TaxID=76717 RepID=UPI0013F34F7C|nr:putative aspartate aminotransferase, cytoplasmic 2 isoform X1 [Lontra canadensis]
MTTLSVFMDVPLAQKLEGSLLKTYKQDSCPNKIFLAFRVCQTSKGHPWVSSVVPKMRLQIAQDPSLNYEYLPVNGMKSFTEAALKLLFGKHNQVIVENRVGGVHTVGDNGAFQLGAQFLKIWRKDSQIVYIISSKKGELLCKMGVTEDPSLLFPSPTPFAIFTVALLTLCHEQDGGQAKYACPFPVIVPPSASDPQTHSLTCLPPFPQYQLEGGCVPTEPYGLVFQDMGFTVREYSFWDSKQLCMDANVLLNVAEQAPHGCIFVIGNICDCNLTQSQWATLMASLKSKQIFLFFDISNQGLSTGDLEKDTGFLQYFVSQGFEFFCSQSLSKTFGIYDEGVGILVVVALNNELLLCVLSQLMKLTQALWLNPPTTGARIITSILCNPALQEEWKQSLKGLVENIMLIKEKVKEKLRLLGTPGSWDHITDQNGSHSYLGLNVQQVEYLVKKKHIYLPKNSRINFTCINAHNIDYITQSINEAVLSTKGLD